MILRQFCARHGRTVLSQSSRTSSRTLETLSNLTPPAKAKYAEDSPAPKIIGHPDDESSILDTLPLHPTKRTKQISGSLEQLENESKSLQSDLNAHLAAKLGGLADPELLESVQAKAFTSSTTITSEPDTPPSQFASLEEFRIHRKQLAKQAKLGSTVTHVRKPTSLLTNPLSPSQVSLPMLLANQTHLGHHTSLWNPSNSSYIFGVRDSIHIISLDITYAYLQRAAKVVREVARRGGIILFVGTRKGQTDIVVNAARRGGAYHIFNRWVPGSLTNGQQILGHCGIKIVDIHDRPLTQYDKILAEAQYSVLKPDLVVCLNPIENQVCLYECGSHTVPTIGIIDTDANPAWVTYPIPANDDSMRSVGLIAGVLSQAAAEGQVLRKEQAAKGRATYSSFPARTMLESLQELADMDVVDAGSAPKGAG